MAGCHNVNSGPSEGSAAQGSNDGMQQQDTDRDSSLPWQQTYEVNPIFLEITMLTEVCKQWTFNLVQCKLLLELLIVLGVNVSLQPPYTM